VRGDFKAKMKNRRNNRQKFILVGFLTVILGLFLNMVYINVAHGDEFRLRAIKQQEHLAYTRLGMSESNPYQLAYINVDISPTTQDSYIEGSEDLLSEKSLVEKIVYIFNILLRG